MVMNRKAVLFLGCILLSVSAVGDDGELLQRRQDEDGLRYWRGATRVVELDGESVLEMRVRRGGESFHQDVRTMGIRSVSWTLKVKPGEDFTGNRITLRAQRSGRASTFTHRPVRGQEWQELSWNTIDVRGNPSLRFMVEAPSGTGTLYFKDLSVRALDTP